MDFGSVLYTAQRNEQDIKQKSVNFYKTSFAPPKKEQRDKKLSLNIQKFLARKEEEERQKKLEEDLKKQKLLVLRNQDKKSMKRVQSMLKRTKSANKSVIEDAVDNVNTAVTLNGPLQPDEDDYGYVSKDAEELYNKLVNKYSNMPPEEPKYSKKVSKSSVDISSTKDRVKAALQREEDEKFGPRKRKRKSKTDEDDAQSEGEWLDEPKKNDDVPQKTEKYRIPKKIQNPAPAFDFHALLKLAEQKQHEPIKIEKNIDDKPDRPMTAKEKQEYLQEKERKMRREGLIQDSVSKDNEILTKKETKSNNTPQKQIPDDKIKLKSPSTSASLKNENLSKKKMERDMLMKTKQSAMSYNGKKNKMNESVHHSKSLTSNWSKNISCDTMGNSLLNERKTLEPSKKSAEMNNAKREEHIPRSNQYDQLRKQNRSEQPVKSTSSGSKSFSKSVISNEPHAKSQSSVRQFPPSDIRPSQIKKMMDKRVVTRELPSSDKLPKDHKVMKRKKIIVSDDEYDSEMDDFIDDSEASMDVSKCIGEIFGYDRRKFSRYDDDDDDDECMESNYSQLQKEEFISTKYGLMEDLEDIRRTKLEKERQKKRIMRR